VTRSLSSECQSSLTAPGMWPVSYSSTSSSDSATTSPGSSRWPATHPVVTTISGWAYPANFAAESDGSATVSLTSDVIRFHSHTSHCPGTQGHHATHCNAAARPAPSTRSTEPDSGGGRSQQGTPARLPSQPGGQLAAGPLVYASPDRDPAAQTSRQALRPVIGYGNRSATSTTQMQHADHPVRCGTDELLQRGRRRAERRRCAQSPRPGADHLLNVFHPDLGMAAGMPRS